MIYELFPKGEVNVITASVNTLRTLITAKAALTNNEENRYSLDDMTGR